MSEDKLPSNWCIGGTRRKQTLLLHRMDSLLVSLEKVAIEGGGTR
jgi:hypothetical protein